jgi:predicted MFS family arabinose efflux permease
VRTPRLLVAFDALHWTLFPIPIVTLFWKDQIGLSLTEIMLLTAIFSLASVLIEFPSGYVADRVGHRVALLVGATLGTVGWTLYAVGDTFAELALAETVLGAGHAFISGADAALLFSSLAAVSETAAYRRWDGRMRAAGQIAEAASAAAGGWLYALAPRLPIGLQIPVAVGMIAVVGRMREPRGATAVETAHMERMLHVVRSTLRHPRLGTAMLLSVVLGLSTFVMVWLIQPWMQRRGIPAAWFGPLWAVAHLWLAATSLASARVAETLGVRATLVACAVLPVVGYAALAVVDVAAAVVFYLCFMTTRGLQTPLLTSVIQADAPDEDRVSVLSLSSLCFRLAFVVAGPPIGALVDRAGLEPALGVLGVAFACLSVVALVVFTRAHANAH